MLSLDAGALGCGNADDVQTAAGHFADAIDEMRRRGAGAKPEPHAGARQGGGALGGVAFQLFDW